MDTQQKDNLEQENVPVLENQEKNVENTKDEQPKEESAQTREQVEANMPYWYKRKYINRAFCFPFLNKNIEGNFFKINGNQVDIDGIIDGLEFNSMQELFALAKWTNEQQSGFADRITKLLSS